MKDDRLQGKGDQGANLVRSAVLEAGYGDTVPRFTAARFCGSALDALNAVAAKVMSGQADCVVAGGVEAALIATPEGFERRDVDAFAAASHQRAAQAQPEGWLER